MLISAGVLFTLTVLYTLASSFAGVILSAVGRPTQQPIYVQRGETLQLLCLTTGSDVSTSRSDVTVTWTRNGTLIDVTARRVRLHSTSVASRLTVLDVRRPDSGLYACSTQRDADQLNVIVVYERQRRPGNTVAIVDPPDDTMSVRHGHPFTLKCVASRSRSLSTRSSGRSRPDGVRWLHNGQLLSEGTGPGFCGRVVITDAVDVDTGWMTSLMTCRSARERELGVYECRHGDGVASDAVTVNVERRREDGLVPVEIIQPATRREWVKVGSNVEMKCKADRRASLGWSFNDSQSLRVGSGIYVTNDVDRVAGVATSLLQLVSVTEQRSGRYSCRNLRDYTDYDTITIIVGNDETEVMDDPDVGIPTLPTLVVMRIRSTISLHCSFKALGQFSTEWTKDGVRLTNRRKYIIRQDDVMSSLTITNTDRNDAGQYQCAFRHNDRRKLAGILTFNVTTLPCPFLRAPTNGRMVLCRQPTLYGARCTFHCNAGYRLSHRTATVCELADDGTTFWTADVPRCYRHGLQIPTTTSSVPLRVGSRLQLRCTDSVLSWSKDGITLQDGFKYRMDGNTLTVRDTVRRDAGVYVCNIHRDLTIVGRNKFNVTLMTCPQLVAPPGVSMERCPELPVYGDTCLFRCHPGQIIAAGNRVRSCEVKGFDTLYWTGEPPVCSGSLKSWSGSRSNSANIPVPVFSSITLPLLLWQAIRLPWNNR